MCSHCSTPTYEWELAVFDFLILCQFADNDGLQIHPCPYKGHKLILFYGCIVFHGVYMPHFPYPVYHQWASMGIWVDSRSLLLKTVLQWIYMCICLDNRMIYNPLGIYPVMRLLGQMEFVFLGPWGVTIQSSTMVELIYTPTDSGKVFLFLHIPSSICLQIF